MDDDRTYRLTRRRNPTTRINLRDVVVARDDRRTERDIPVAPPPTTGPLAAPPTPAPIRAPAAAAPQVAGGSLRDLPRLNRSTLPLPPITRAPGSGVFPPPAPAPASAAPVVPASATTAPALAPRPAGFPARRHAQGTASTIERRSFGGVELLIEHRGDEVTLIIPGAAPLVGTRAQVIALIAGLLGRT